MVLNVLRLCTLKKQKYYKIKNIEKTKKCNRHDDCDLERLTKYYYNSFKIRIEMNTLNSRCT